MFVLAIMDAETLFYVPMLDIRRPDFLTIDIFNIVNSNGCYRVYQFFENTIFIVLSYSNSGGTEQGSGCN
jgi:hypothetical protein